MGTYTDFCVAGYPLINSKSAVVPEAMTVFRESDRRVEPRRLGDRNVLVWGDAYAEEADEIETATQYICSTDAAIGRLDVMGFTLDRVKREFDEGLLAELNTNREWAKNEPGKPWNAETIELLESMSFDSYMEALRQVIREGLRPEPFDDYRRPELSAHVRYILGNNDELILGFFSLDVRGLIRAACEVAQKPSTVVQDITDLVDGGYYEVDQPVCQEAIDALVLGHVESSKRIILTEGSTDSRFLKDSLDILYPHLSEYYSFLDFDGVRVAGGAGQLTSLIKGFSAAGIGNQIVAIFDNDAAARDAQRSLSKLQLPPNIVVLSYPELPLLRSYPTLGPSGRTELDVNGLAASIELYFGEDILRRGDATLIPVQWKGYMEALGCYQGEVLGKGDLQEAFARKIARARSDPSSRATQDWSGMDAILKLIFGAFASES